MENSTDYITKSAKKLNLQNDITDHATRMYEKAVTHPAIKKTRIKDSNVALACLYIANRLYSKQPHDQNVFVYKFTISFATLRKCYIKICDALNIDRDKIVSKHHLKKE